MEVLLIVLLFLAVFALMFFKTKKAVKPTAIKKEELIDSYKQGLDEILQKYKDDKETKLKEKIKYIKKINDELSMNIFFEQQEAKKILQELSSME